LLFIMNNMDTEILRRIGFSEQETKLYLALLALGPVTATAAASEAGIDRATAYRFLSSLQAKGFVSSFMTEGATYFSAASPTKLVEDTKEKLARVKGLVPELARLESSAKGRTRVELYKGTEGLKAILKEVLAEGEEYTFFGEVEKFFSELPAYTDLWLERVERAGIRGRLVLNESSEFKVARTERYRLIGKDFISKISVWTYGRKTAFFIWSSPPFGIVIDDPDVAKSNLNIFNFLWAKARRPDKASVRSTRRTGGYARTTQ